MSDGTGQIDPYCIRQRLGIGEGPARAVPGERRAVGAEELQRLLRIAVTRLGITNVRFTGGEPLLRRGLTGLVAAEGAHLVMCARGVLAVHRYLVIMMLAGFRSRWMTPRWCA